MYDRIDGLAAIAERYDGYVIDVWGTLYDGGEVFPAALDALRALAGSGKAVVILSNSPRLPSAVAGRLERIGLGADLYREIITSGGESHRHLRDRVDALHGGLGPLAYGFAPSRFTDILPGTGFEPTDDLDAADWILNAGPEGETDTVAVYEAAMRRGVERGLLMLCANPDRLVVDRGVLKIHAGALADRYQELGGRVHYHGKPHAPVFARSIARLGVPPCRVLVIGDNRATDVAGAVAAGLDSLMLADGVHREELFDDARMSDDRVGAFLGTPGPKPRWVAERLGW